MLEKLKKLLSSLFKTLKKDITEDITEEIKLDFIKDNEEILIDLNIKLRTGVTNQEILKLFELLIDDLLYISNLSNTKLPNTTLTWQVNRIISNYLPAKIVHPYLAMLDSERNTKKSIKSIEYSIDILSSEAKSIKDVIENSTNNEFDMKAKFIEAKFN